MRFRVILAPLLLAAGCSTALSSINDADLTKVRVGRTRAEVERVVGRADGREPLPDGGERITYHLKLGRPKSDGADWGSTEATLLVGDAFGSGDWGCLVVIPAVVMAATFVVTESIATSRELHRLHQARRYDLVVEYDRAGCVRNTLLVCREPGHAAEP